eukprot:12843306-Ditylum_brightwellii.AAC.2
MPGYIVAALQKFQHNLLSQPEYSPHEAAAPVYKRGLQYSPPPETSPPVSDKHKNKVQQIVGILLFYVCVVNCTMLMVLNSIAGQQANPTKKTAKAVVKLLNYCATNSNVVIRYRVSKMVLHIHSDASFMLVEEARSCAGGHFFLSEPYNAKPTFQPVPINGPVNTMCKVIHNVMASVVEVEIGALFSNTWKGEELCTAL